MKSIILFLLCACNFKNRLTMPSPFLLLSYFAVSISHEHTGPGVETGRLSEHDRSIEAMSRLVAKLYIASIICMWKENHGTLHATL